MEKQFELVMPNQGRVMLIWFGGIVLLLALALGGMSLLSFDKNLTTGWMVVALLGGIYGLFRLTKTVGSEAKCVTLNADRLVVLNRRTGVEQHVPFTAIASYRFLAFNGAEELRLKLKDDSKVKIGISTQLHSEQDLTELVREFEAALGQHQQDQPSPASLREKTFFEKPMSTVLLGLMAVPLAVMTWFIILDPSTVKGSTFMGYSGFIAYLVAWYAARERRRQ